MTANDIMDAINLRLLEHWPRRTVYRDVCPVDFDRPSFWIVGEEERITQLTARIARHEIKILLTLFDERDDHREVSWARLSREAEEASAAIGPVIYAIGRALTVTRQILPRVVDQAQIRISGTWHEGLPREEPPAVDELQLHLAVAVDDGTGEKTVINNYEFGGT